ncbi:MAG: DUF5615 family PIN-like protein [Acidobacteria bacterium]|nr:DUF5615 family PIN-like protein [Acidobacteriota bacterium]
MRVLLDECLPRRLKREFKPPHSALSVAEVGWSGISNGMLLSLAAPKFDVFLTSDTNLELQQNLRDLSLIIVVLFAPSNDINVLAPLIPEVTQALADAKPGQVLHIGR